MADRILRIGTVIMTLLLGSNCSDPRESTQSELHENGRGLDEIAIARLAAWSIEDSAVIACGAGNALAAERTLRLVANGRQCYSCRQLGFWARRIETMARTSSVSGFVIVPRVDVADVCDFLRRQRVSLPVATLDGDLNEIISEIDDPYVIATKGGSALGSAAIGAREYAAIHRILWLVDSASNKEEQ